MPAKKIPMAKIKSMFKAYCEEQGAAYVARKCNVHYRTAEKYVFRGDPPRGIEPFYTRFQEIQKQAAKKEDYDLAEASRQTLVLLRAYKAKLAEKLKSLDPNKIPDELSGAIDRVLKAEQLLLGGPTERGEQKTLFTWEDLVADIRERKREAEKQKGEMEERGGCQSLNDLAGGFKKDT